MRQVGVQKHAMQLQKYQYLHELEISSLVMHTASHTRNTQISTYSRLIELAFSQHKIHIDSAIQLHGHLGQLIRQIIFYQCHVTENQQPASQNQLYIPSFKDTLRWIYVVFVMYSGDSAQHKSCKMHVGLSLFCFFFHLFFFPAILFF